MLKLPAPISNSSCPLTQAEEQRPDRNLRGPNCVIHQRVACACTRAATEVMWGCLFIEEE